MKRFTILALVVLGFIFSPLQAQFNFSATGLNGVSITNPTSLDFGPDGRLYVAVQSGEIYAYTVQRQSANSYNVMATETILSVKQIQNHNDNDGALHNVVKRQITGLMVDGTATHPIIYVTSSDYRIGGGGGGSDINLDTNSGIISRLVWDGSQWIKVDLVRGLPRSEENHSTNGLQIDKINNILYVASGGNTNAGAPSNNFAFLTEYALSAAILSVDLNDINARPVLTDALDGSLYIYDLPTLDDPTRANANGIDDPNQPGYNGIDINDPFGGNDGLNQAKWTTNSPVQVYATGFRNAFDVVLTQDGKMYTWDNGANQGWGGHPANEGVGTATNNWVIGEPGSTGPGPNDDKVNNKDGLHFISGQGYYGGHPNPVRANPLGAGLFTHDHANGAGGLNGVWRQAVTGNPANTLPVDWPPVDPSLADPIEGDFQNAGVDDPSLFTITASTNGMAEYTASNFSGQMQGNLLAASFNGNIYSVNRNAQGSINSASDVSVLATGFGAVPLDVCSQGDNDIFPGTIWSATYGSNAITIFEPQDFVQCSGADDPTIDEDFDGYSNADEIANGTDPCNGASFPADNDKTLINGFKVSDLNDPDDDDDGLNDQVDFFALDASNGTTLNIAFDYPLLNGDPGIGLYGLGFTGFMSNGINDYLELYKNEDNSPVEIIAGGAVGLLSFNNAPAGSPFGANNDLKNGFQFGVQVDQQTLAFELETAILGPLFQANPQGDQFHAFYIGTGDQDNYIMIGANANQGNLVMSVWQEENGQLIQSDFPLTGLAAASEISFFLEINPLNQSIQPKIDFGNGVQNLGAAITFPAFMQTIFSSNQALAVGVATGKASADPSFNATYDYIKANFTPNTLAGEWTYINNASSCQALGNSGSCPQGRHEAAYVQAGEYFVLLGGREHGSNVNLYHPTTDTWTAGAALGFPLHHFQAMAHEGLVYVVGGMTGNFPNETPLDRIYIYDPLADAWHQGPIIPQNRRRGSAGSVVYQDKFYLIGGIQNGHTSGWVPWFDQFDPASNTWTALNDAPRSRDHFHASLKDGKLYAAGGRNTGLTGYFSDNIAAVDVYDFNTQSWSTLANNLPRPVAAASTAIIGNELLVIGGEDTAATASNLTQALSLSDYNWRLLDSLNEGRHGTQAIVNNQKVYLASGSPVKGGGQLLTQEVFSFLANPSLPQLNASIKSNLALAAAVDFGTIAAGQSAQATIWLKNQNGNQAILIDSILWQQGTLGLNASIAAGLPLHLGVGDSIALTISAALSASFQDSLQIFSSASNSLQKLSVKGQVAISQAVLINCGGPAFTTASGEEFLADQYFANGSQYQKVQPISNTNDDDLYHSERYNTNLQYSIPVDANGSYLVDLHFAEIYAPNFFTGARVFDIRLEGNLVEAAFDIFDTVGGAAALIKTYSVVINDGSLELSLESLVENAKISAIAVRPAAAPLLFNPSSHHFQSTPLSATDSISLSLVNSSANLVLIDSVKLMGAHPQDFSHNLNTNTAIPAAYTSNFTAYFQPQSSSPVVRSAQLQVYYDGGLIPAVLSLSGEAACPAAGQSCDDGDASTTNDTTDGNCNCAGTTVIANAFSLHINVGGPAYTAANGDQFSSDQYFLNGSTAGALQSIAGTDDSTLYSSERWAANLAYAIPLTEAADYRVTLYFAEIWSGAFAPNKRVFDVTMEDSLYINDLDIYNQVGAKTAYALTYTVAVNDGLLNINTQASLNNAKLSAISIEKVISTPSALPYLSATALNFTSTSSTSLDSALVYLVNPNTLIYSIDSILASGADTAAFSLQTASNILPGGDSLAMWLYFNPINLLSGTYAANYAIYLSGVNTALSLDAQAIINCLPTGTPCNDGDANTINDQEDGNCNCVGTPNQPQSFSLNINAGGPAYTSANSGKVYMADQYFQGGIPISTSTTIDQTTDMPLYQSARLGKNMSYLIPLPQEATYQVTLHFAEIQNYLMQAGRRVFDISAEGVLVIDDLDITNLVGGNQAYSITFSVEVADGELNLNTAASVNNSLISAIEISSGTAPPAPSPILVALSSAQVSLSAAQGQMSSMDFYIYNNDSITRSLDSLLWSAQNAALSLNIAQGQNIAAGDSLLGSFTYQGNLTDVLGSSLALTYYLNGDSLNQSIDLLSTCPVAGSACDDGDSTTLNDMEDGNCKCAGSPIVNPNPNFSLNINCGGAAYQSAAGKNFIADQYFQGGFSLSSSATIANTSDASLYQKYRIGKNMSYAIPMPSSGEYEVTLHFAELQNYLMKPNARIFSISVEGQAQISNLDVFTAAGAGAAAHTETFTTLISDGELNINTAASSENSILSAIEITAMGGSAKRGLVADESAVEVQALRLAIYPNPAQNELFVEASAAIKQIRILSSDGKILRQEQANAVSMMTLDCGNLSSGFYLLQVETAEGLMTKRFMKD